MVWTHQSTAKKGFWAQMLGFGDFYYELGVQIVEVCLRSVSLAWHRMFSNHSPD